MIQNESLLIVADNSGARKAKCIKVLGGTKKRYGRVGDVIRVAIREALPKARVKKGQVARAVIVRTKKNIARTDGTVVRFDSNAIVLVDPKGEPVGTRIFGPIARELRGKGFVKIVSLAPEVL